VASLNQFATQCAKRIQVAWNRRADDPEMQVSFSLMGIRWPMNTRLSKVRYMVHYNAQETGLHGKSNMMSAPNESFERAESAEPRDPQSTEDAISLFSDPDYCVKYLAYRRWPSGQVTCPTCGSANVTWLARRRMWECRGRHPQAQFSVRSGTLLEDSRIGLGQWLTALWFIAERGLTISSYDMARRIGITQKSAWLLLKRIRKTMEAAAIGTENLAVRAPYSG
jgi:hypothetical protein